MKYVPTPALMRRLTYLRGLTRPLTPFEQDEAAHLDRCRANRRLRARRQLARVQARLATLDALPDRRMRT